jgi:type II secretory ATPase GspE/PulE/Tfp pilus assembly ATPase PilB-like protein
MVDLGLATEQQIADALADQLGLTLVDLNLQDANPVRGTGCSECARSGYRGRLGVFEVLPVGHELRRVLAADPSEASVTAATTGLRTVRDAALARALAGETTFEEVARVSPRQ